MTSSEQAEPKKRRWRVTRRGFLLGAGATGAVGVAALSVGLPFGQTAIAGLLDGGSQPSSLNAAPMAWLDISADNTVTLHIHKTEMGQGVHTSLGQLVAEELEIDWSQLKVVHAAPQRGLDANLTGGSNSVSSMFIPLRQMAATVREMMRTAAATELGVNASALTAAAGAFTVAGSDQSITYGELVATEPTWVELETPPELKPASEWQYVGKPMQRVDFLAKLTGTAAYGFDARMPNMLYGAVARPPTIGATFKSAANGDAATKPGVVEVVIEDDFAGVVAESRLEADLARNALAVEWDEGELYQQADLEALVTVGNGSATIVQKSGKPLANLKDGEAVIAEYRTPMAVHAHLEPQSALVDVQPDRVTVIASTQSTGSMAKAVAEALGVEESIVDVQVNFVGGGFGRKLNTELTAIEAARLSRATGRPVHVGWNRREEFRNGYLRPPTHHILKATINDSGLIHAMEHQQASGDVAFPFFPAFAQPILGADFGAWRGGIIHYSKIEHRRTVAWRTKMPIPTGWWRGLGLLANTFAVESFMDEVAHAAGADPLEFRLAQLGNDEKDNLIRGVIEAAAERANWGGGLPEGRALGIAASIDVGTPCAQVAEVSIDNGRIRVHKVTSAIDPGTIINPDGVSAQSQGSIIMGMGSTFFEKINIKDGKVEAANFNKYPLITMKDSPEIDVVMLQNGEPRGVGEPPIGPIAAAIGNAVFALTGQRLRELPLQLA